ncbi:MAG: rRNA maturation RNase YbeY [Thiobacillus sp.]
MTNPDSPGPKLSLAVQYASDAKNLPTRAQIRRWIRGSLVRSAEITVRIADEAEARALNLDYRNKDYATNVLTFEYGTTEHSVNGDTVLSGDIVICAAVVDREAAEQRKLVIDHYAHLIVHGALHLQGFDHDDAVDADIMETREAAILKRFGIANPYLSDI